MGTSANSRTWSSRSPAQHRLSKAHPWPTGSRFLRIAYAVQFVVTVIAIFEVWGQVGGQGHIDMMPWYAKLLLSSALSIATVKATAAAVDRDHFENKLMTAWLAAAPRLNAPVGRLTLYWLMHKPADMWDGRTA